MSSDRQTAAVVLAAGKGTRMKSQRPKVLHAIAGRPMIGHVLATLSGLKPARVAVVVAPGMEAVAKAVAPVACVVQRQALGTGDAVKAARQTLNGFTGDVLIVYADTPLVTGQTLRNLMAARAKPPYPSIVVLGMRLQDGGAYGRLIMDAKGNLDRIVEAKDASEAERKIALVNSGFMLVDGAILFQLLDELSNDNAKHEYYLTDIVKLARGRGLTCAAVEGRAAELRGVNSRAELSLAESVMQNRLRAGALEAGASLIGAETIYFSADTRLSPDVTIGPYVVFGPGVTIGEGAEIRSFCHIERARIGKRAIIGPFARLRPGADIGEDAHVGNFVEIKNATLAPGAKANHLSYIGDAKIGAKANVGAGTITCNYDGFEKAITEIGEGAFIGSNTALVAPVKVGARAIVGAGSVITEDVPADALAIGRGAQTSIKGGAARYRDRKTGKAQNEKATGAKPAKAAKTNRKSQPAKRAKKAAAKSKPKARR